MTNTTTINPGLTTRDLGNGESSSAGIDCPDHAGDKFTAMTHTNSARFKTLGGAVRWLARRGYNPDGTRMVKS